MGEVDPTRFPFSFNRSLAFEGRPERLTRDAGALLLRETDERMGLTRRTPWKDMRKAWRRALRKAGLDGRRGLTPHALRHTHATRFLQGGGSPRDLQGQLGHADLRTTMIYSDLVDERRRRTVLSLPFGTGPKAPIPSSGGGTGGGTPRSEGSVKESPANYEVA